MGELLDKTALVTGGGRGIGQAIALAFAREGARIVICSRTERELDAVAEKIREAGVEVLPKVCDVTDEDQVMALVESIEARFGRLDILVNNAGGEVEPGSVRGSMPRQWWQTVEINVFGTYLVTRLALPLLERSAPAKIINIGSGMGREPHPGNSSYNVAKAGTWMFTRCLAQEVWELGIDVNEIIPGPVRTQATKVSMPAGGPPPFAASERIKPPEEVAELALWLAGRPAGGPTGQSFSLARRPL
jgi:3-oxoacyl-[acyl-carrier protein] reductase